MKKKLAVVDISSFIFRAFFAVRQLNAPDGTPVNAVYGVLSMLLKLLSEYRPSHIVLARDVRGGSFRNELYSEYKANRSEPPEDLIPQFDLIEKLIEALKLPSIAIQNYEADDVIGSIAIQWAESFEEIDIVSGDKDLMQFINGNIKMVDTQKGKIYGRDEVFEKMGVYPEQVLDYLSMVGDASDNVPGMRGIGAKGAAKLLAEYQTLDNCFKHKEELKNKRVRTAFDEFMEDGRLSKKLITIVSDLELPLGPEQTEYRFSPDHQLYDFLQGLGFTSFVNKIKKMSEDEARAEGEEGDFSTIRQSMFDSHDYHLLNKESWTSLKERLSSQKNIFIYTEYSDRYDLYFLGVSYSEKEAYITNDELLAQELLATCFAYPDCCIYSLNVQKDLLYALLHNISIQAETFSVGQAHFIANSQGKSTIEYLSSHYLMEEVIPLERGEKVEALEGDRLLAFAGQRTSALSMIAPLVEESVIQKELLSVYKDIDAPLFQILSTMEKEGILINKNFFEDLYNDFDQRLRKIEENIFTASGSEINLKSPKQVGELLFEKLNLPVIKKTKTGFSTDSEVLEKLKEFSDIPAYILEYRELEKLLSTYVKVIPEIAWSDSRVHTHFNLNIAATGRLSSVNPNLQNIPVRSANGKLIRKGFVAKPGHLLLSADYSQVELRLLAHFSQDEVMVDAFNHDKDIHAQTAAEVEKVPLENVSSEQRARAKAVNFGLMYGQSAFGLASSLGISRTEAKDYINFYFERFGKVKGYLDSLKEFASQHGYVETMHGRKRFIPDINSKNRTVKAMAERVAINSPVQGTAADIIKLAMIKIVKRMEQENLSSKMLLQVHDELIFEVPDAELATMKSLIREEMENIVDLRVPLRVDMGVGVNWFDVK